MRDVNIRDRDNSPERLTLQCNGHMHSTLVKELGLEAMSFSEARQMRPQSLDWSVVVMYQ